MPTKDHSEQTILVTGATGKQGGSALRHLRSNGFSVRALTRDPTKPAARALVGEGVSVVGGSLDDFEAVRKAVDGVFGVFSVQTPFEEGLDAEVRQGKALADAAQRAGVSHFVYSSVAGADQNTGIPHFESKNVIEQHVRSLGMSFTIFRPVFFMENWFWSLDSIRQGTLTQPLSPGTRLAMVAVDDIGAFAARAFEFPDHWKNRSFELAGDELSMNEVAQKFGAKLGREVRYVQEPWEAYEKRSGDDLTRMFHFFEDRGYDVDLSKVRAEYSGLHDFGRWLEAQRF